MVFYFYPRAHVPGKDDYLIYIGRWVGACRRFLGRRRRRRKHNAQRERNALSRSLAHSPNK